MRRGSGDTAIVKSFLACETITCLAIHALRVLHFSAFIFYIINISQMVVMELTSTLLTGNLFSILCSSREREGGEGGREGGRGRERTPFTLFMLTLTPSHLQSLTHSPLIPLSLFPSLCHSLTCTCTHTHTFTHSLTHSLTVAFTQSIQTLEAELFG